MKAEAPGTIPSRSWQDADGHTMRVLQTNPGDECVIAGVHDRRHDVRASVAFTATQLREIAADALDRAEALDNVTGRNRKTWRWHVREGERLLAYSRNVIVGDPLIQRAMAHFQAAQVLRGTTTVHIHQSEGDTT